MNIYTIIVSYNGIQWQDRCLGSLYKSNLKTHVIVIDNASTDNSVSHIKTNYPEVHLIEKVSNIGFAKANNIGIKKALENNADYVFLLNQDAWIEDDTLGELINAFIENDSVGIVSPIHLNGSNTGLDIGFTRCMGPDFISDTYMGNLRKYYSVPYVNAAAWMISRQCIEKIGGFDTLLFTHYGEDNNYCQRLQYHNLQLIINTKARIFHDREQRMTVYDDHREQWRKVLEWEELSEQWSDINNDYDFPQLRKRYRQKRMKSILLSNKTASEQYSQILNMITLVEQSRKINKAEGCHWIS